MLWRAKEISSNSAFSETFDRAIFILNNLKKSSDVASFLNDKTLDKDNLPVFLDALSIVLRDMIAAKTDKNLIMSKHKEWEIETLSKGFSLDALSNILYLVNEERKKLSFYVEAPALSKTCFSVFWRLNINVSNDSRHKI